MQDDPKPQKDKPEEINLAQPGEDPRITYISEELPTEFKEALISLLKEYRDVFAWKYDEMPGLDPRLVTHKLNILPGSVPIKQSPRKFRPEDEIQIKQEIQKLLDVGFIRPTQHPTWLANIVPVKKKNGQIRVCVDFRDLNKACPKDEFPLPNIDTLVDATAGCEMLSLADQFSGYNQIPMAKEDAEKTAFRTPMGNFYYTVMPFGLKNAGVTYQRAMTAIFHDMIHGCTENYADDIVVKSRQKEKHLNNLRQVFDRARQYKLRMNPLKCAFGVSAGKFLGCMHRNGISIDPSKAEDIKNMLPPNSVKQLKSFMGKVSYVMRFIPALSELMSAFQPLLKKGVPFVWKDSHNKAFEKVKSVLASPTTITIPVKGIPLILYLTSTPRSIGALLAQETNGVERPVYYLSRIIKGPERNYSAMEKHCLSLAFAMQKFRHYLLAHKVFVITRSDPIQFLLTRPALSGRIAKWLLLTSEFDITAVQPKAIKSQALADLLAHFPSKKI